jgi:hypothetical protein
MSNQALNASDFKYNFLAFNAIFEGILAKIVECYKLMIKQTTTLPDNDENIIRDELVNNYLNDNKIRRKIELTDYLFEPEVPEKKGRVDIKIISKNTFSDTDAYYIIECKRLNSDKQNAKGGLNGKYISGGIARFALDGKYSTHGNTAGMIGFVVSKMDIHENVVFINQLLCKTFTDINTEKELTKRQVIPDFEYLYYSNHKVGNVTKTIYHLMLDFSGNINKSRQENGQERTHT